ncbi:16152_t:CDS:2, partial [Acaulospora morrowiae]
NNNISTSTTPLTTASSAVNTIAHQPQKLVPLTSQTTSSATEQHHHRSHSHPHHTHTKSGDQHQDSQQQNNDDDQVEQEEQQKGFKGQAKKDMRHVEGYVADREGYGIDDAKLAKAMTFVNEEYQKQKALKLKKQKEAEKIAVSKEDIDFIIKEMDVTKA